MSILGGRNPATITAKDVAGAANPGDPLASLVGDETMLLLGAGIASIIHAFNLQIVVLGGVTHVGDQLFEPVRRVVRERTMPWSGHSSTVVPAELGERTGVLGAVAVALERIRATPAGPSWDAMRGRDG